MKVNNPLLKAKFEISEKDFIKRKSKKISDQIDKDILEMLLKKAKNE